MGGTWVFNPGDSGTFRPLRRPPVYDRTGSQGCEIEEKSTLFRDPCPFLPGSQLSEEVCRWGLYPLTPRRRGTILNRNGHVRLKCVESGTKRQNTEIWMRLS